MKIWEVDDNGSPLYRTNSANSIQDEINREANSPYSFGASPNTYSPYGQPGPPPMGANQFPIMPPTYGGPTYGLPTYGPPTYGSQPMFGSAPYGSAPGYGQPPGGRVPDPGQFSPILPPDFMRDPEEEEQSKGPDAELAVLGPTLLQQQMMAATKQPLPQQQQQQQQRQPLQQQAPAVQPAMPQPAGFDQQEKPTQNTMIPRPATGNLVTRETDKLNKRNQKLLMGILLLSLFILGAIVGLIVLTVTKTPATPEPVITTKIRFTMIRTDMTYGQELSDKMTYSYLDTEKRFCDTISAFYLKGAFIVNDCKTVSFRPGSVVATLEISVVNNGKTNEQVFLYVSSILVAKSDADISVKTIEESSIVEVSS